MFPLGLALLRFYFRNLALWEEQRPAADFVGFEATFLFCRRAGAASASEMHPIRFAGEPAGVDIPLGRSNRFDYGGALRRQAHTLGIEFYQEKCSILTRKHNLKYQLRLLRN
jgi:hypothetical protein